jgi:pimeloyl-ACP methyl ester carboxylesterase
MTSSGLSYDHYQTGGVDEWLMGIGSPHAPPILFVPPLFEELNRTRALIAGIMRRVAAEGFGCWLPDLPGTGESGRPLETVSWEMWRNAVKAAAEQLARGGSLAAIVAIRGGCLLDDSATAACVWRFAPVAGTSLIRDLQRAGLAAGGGNAGYELAPTLIGPLDIAAPASLPRVRTVRLASDRAEADLKVEGPALWRRSEPETKSELAAPIASDIVTWVRTCGAS